MTEDKLQLSHNELEELLIKTCDCVLIGTEGVSLDKCDTYIDKIRPFFVSTLERRIYAFLEKFVYGEDADRFHEQFPCLKKCIDTATTLSGPANKPWKKYIGTEIMEGAIKGTIKYLIKEGLFTAFINSVVLNNRINRICRQLDALGIEKTCLGYLNVWNFICAKDYWIGNSFQAPMDDLLSDLMAEVGTEDQESVPINNLKRRADDDPCNENNSETETSSAYKIRRTNADQAILKTKSSVSDSYKKMTTEHLRVSILKVQFADCGCVDVVRSTKFTRLNLPSKPEDLIKKIFKVEKNLLHSCMTPIRKKFEDSLHNICSCLNDVLSRTNKGTIKNLYLLCEIRPGYVSFKLKSIQGQSSRSKPCLFSARIATCRSVFKNQISFRKSLTKEDRKTSPRKEIYQNDFRESSSSKIPRAYYCESHLSDVQEKEEECNEIDVREISNSNNIPNPETVFREETNSMISLEIEKDSNNVERPKFTCSCGQASTCSRSSSFEIEMKLRDAQEDQISFRKSLTKEDLKTSSIKEIYQNDVRESSSSKIPRAYYCESHLSDVQEKEEECNEIDVREINNSDNIPDLETVFGEETNSKISLEIEKDSNNVERSKFTCSCGQASTCSRRSFFEIEMKLRDVLDCFKKPILKEVEPVLKKQEVEKIGSRKRESDNLEEVGESDLNNPSASSSNLEELKVSETIFPDLKEVNISECVCSTKEDLNLLKNETNDSKIVPDSQDLPETDKISKETKSQIPIPISSRKKISQVSTEDVNFEKEPILKEEESIPSKIPLLVKEKPTVSGVQISLSMESKSRLQSTEKFTSIVTSTSKKRIAKPERCSEFSRSSQLKKSDHLVKAEASSKSSNLASAKPANRSVASVPKRQEKVPKAAKRNFITRPNPQSGRSSEVQQINRRFTKNRESVCSKTFVKDKAENSLLNVYPRNQEKVPQRTYIIVTDSEEGIDQCDSNYPCRQFISEKIPLGLSLQSQNQHSLDLELSSSCHLKSESSEMVSPIFNERKKRSNFRSVSVQTAERKMISKGINIDIKETRETSSKALNLDCRRTSTKGVNVDLICKDSIISLETNVTKIISVFDITIFEEDFERLKKPLKEVLEMSNICQDTCQPTNTCKLANHFPARNNCSGSYEREKNSKLHLRSENNSEVSAEVCKGIANRSCHRRQKMNGTGNSWTTSNKTRTQNIINAICDPFSNKSIKRIKYLIQTKLCRILLDRDSNNSSKTFVSSQRYYVSASSEKGCYSPGSRNFSASSESKSSSDRCCRKERMAGGSDKINECPIRIGSGWEFGGDEDCFLIRKKGRISKEKDVKTPKERDSKKYYKTCRDGVRTFKGKDEKCEKYLEFGKEEGRNKSKERKNTFPGDVITSSHLGRRHGKSLRKRSFRSCSCHESDKENDGRESKKGSQVTSIGREWSQLSSKEMLRTKGRSRVGSGRAGIDESFCDLEQNVRTRLSEYVDLCKSAKYFLMKGSHDVYRVSSTSIPFSDRSEFRRL